jgi:hypothetical protein
MILDPIEIAAFSLGNFLSRERITVDFHVSPPFPHQEDIQGDKA